MTMSVSKVIRSALGPLGIEVRRTPSRTPSQDFYPTVSSCQIPHLSAKFEQFLGARSAGQFVEVGAFDGVSYSNSWGLAEREWRGLMLEPIPDHARLCVRAHAGHPNVTVLETAVSDKKENMNFFVGGAFTTALPEQVEEFSAQDWAREDLTDQTMTRAARTLDDILREQQVTAGFDVLIVDVEGHETAVFNGFDVDLWAPAMIIVELADVHPDLVGVRSEHAGLYRKLLLAGYTVAYKDAINTMLVRDDVYEAGVSTVRST